MDPESCLILFAKVPAAGHCKTRLCPPLTPAEAAALYRAFLADVVVSSPRHGGAHCRLAVLPPAGHPLGEVDAGVLGIGRLPEGIRMFAQSGPDLGARLAHAVECAFDDGYRRVVVRNTDAPMLPADRVREAFSVLREGAECVLGPDFGGGYYLAGSTAPRPELFRDLANWQAHEVFANTVLLARRAGLVTAVLREEADCDVPEDLTALVRALAAAPERAPATSRVCGDLGLESRLGLG